MGAVVPRQEPERDGLLRLRHQFFALTRMKIATWNINGIKARIDTVVDLAARGRSRHRCLQEIKSLDEGFPAGAHRGSRLQCRHPRPEGLQRRRDPLQSALRRGDPRPARRRCRRPGPLHGGRRLGRRAERCGSPPSTCPTAIRSTATNTPTSSPGWTASMPAPAPCWPWRKPFFLAGDYNAIPEPRDAKRPQDWVGDALFLPQTRAHFHALTHLGLTDAVRSRSPATASTPSGTIRPAPGRKTTASASTTS